MLPHSRRRLLTGLFSTCVASLSSSWKGVASERDRSRMGTWIDSVARQDDRAGSMGFVIAKQRRSYESFEILDAQFSLDFWTARVSDIEITAFPRHVTRVVVWDDIFHLRTLKIRVEGIIDAIECHYGFDCCKSTQDFIFYLEGVSNLSALASSILPPRPKAETSLHVAMIDCDATGVSNLDWPTLLPSMRAHYDLIIGLTHFPGSGPREWRVVTSAQFAEHEYAEFLIRLERKLLAYDIVAMTSDGLLGKAANGTHEYSNSAALTDLVHSLMLALENRDVRGRLLAVSTEPSPKPLFIAVGALTLNSSCTTDVCAVRSQRDLVAREFGTPFHDEPIVFTPDLEGSSPPANSALAVWPFKASAVCEGVVE